MKKTQLDLKKALSDLETAKTEEETEKCRSTVQEVKEKSEKAIVVLQVGTDFGYNCGHFPDQKNISFFLLYNFLKFFTK